MTMAEPNNIMNEPNSYRCAFISCVTTPGEGISESDASGRFHDQVLLEVDVRSITRPVNGR